MFASQGQAQAFLTTIYAGLAAGVAYDLLRLLRLSLHAGKIVTAILDIVFWLLTAGLVASAAALSGEEGLRYYLFLGAASGVLLWAAGLRRIIRGAVRLTARGLSRLGGQKRASQAGKTGSDGERLENQP